MGWLDLLFITLAPALIYNITREVVAPFTGCTHSVKIRAKMSDSQKRNQNSLGHTPSFEHRAAISKAKGGSIIYIYDSAKTKFLWECVLLNALQLGILVCREIGLSVYIWILENAIVVLSLFVLLLSYNIYFQLIYKHNPLVLFFIFYSRIISTLVHQCWNQFLLLRRLE